MISEKCETKTQHKLSGKEHTPEQNGREYLKCVAVSLGVLCACAMLVCEPLA